MDSEIEKTDIDVEMVQGDKPTRTYNQHINGISPLGKEIKISPKSVMTINDAGYKVHYYCQTVAVVIGIGKDYTADLIMDIDAWRALKSGEKIHISTVKGFKKKIHTK